MYYTRQEIVDIFSTFIQFEDDRFNRWIPDVRLRRSMQTQLERLPDANPSDSSWSLYWYRVWQREVSVSLAEMHLLAYLQEPCYLSAKQTSRKVINLQYKLSDYFQMAITRVRKVLKSYSPEQYSSLKLYATIAFSSILRDILRQRHEADITSDWTLLRKVSKKRFIQALEAAGLASSDIAQYHLAWICFKELYAQRSPTGERFKVSQDLWEGITNLYNTERLNQLPNLSKQRSSTTLEQWLTNCSRWVRAYLYPPVDSINTPLFGRETGEIQDHLCDPLFDSPLTEMMIQEENQTRQAHQAQINEVLLETLQHLDPQSQELLRLYYQLSFSQKRIAEVSELSQPTVARRLMQARKDLLAALLDWSQNALNRSPTSTLIKDMSAALEDWLKVHYNEPNFSFGLNIEASE
jgi:RNA polymerase sigma factor (sigma-70 family)